MDVCVAGMCGREIVRFSEGEIREEDEGLFAVLYVSDHESFGRREGILSLLLWMMDGYVTATTRFPPLPHTNTCGGEATSGPLSHMHIGSFNIKTVPQSPK